MKTVLTCLFIVVSISNIYAQKIANVSNGKLQICDLNSDNRTTNSFTTSESNVVSATIGTNKIAIVFSNGKLAISNIDKSSNRFSNYFTTSENNVVSAQMGGDNKVIITYSNGKKYAAPINESNRLGNGNWIY